MKLLDIIGTARSNMMRSKVRTILTIIAIFVGAFTITLTLGLSAGISSYIDEQLGSIGAEDVLVVQPKVEVPDGTGPKEYDPNKASASGQAAFLSSMLDKNDIEKVREVKGLSDIRPALLVTPDYIIGQNDKKYQVSIQQFVEGMNFDLTAGTMPDNRTSEPQILLPKDYVRVLGYTNDQAAVGKRVDIAISNPSGTKRTVDARIVGVQQVSILSQGGMTANDSLVEALYAAQTEGLPPEVTQKYVGVTSHFDVAKGEAELTRIKSDLDKLGYTGSTVKDQVGIIKNIIDAITAVLVFFGAIALLAATFGIINTLYMSVQERTKEIGLMKAIGMSQSKVFLLFSVEAILIGFWGSVIGVLAAVGVGQVANQVASQNFLKDLPGFELTAFPIQDIAAVMLLIMFIAFLAGTLPARRAAKQDPIAALRYE